MNKWKSGGLGISLRGADPETMRLLFPGRIRVLYITIVITTQLWLAEPVTKVQNAIETLACLTQ
jgi:hypothetical protein